MTLGAALVLCIMAVVALMVALSLESTSYQRRIREFEREHKIHIHMK